MLKFLFIHKWDRQIFKRRFNIREGWKTNKKLFTNYLYRWKRTVSYPRMNWLQSSSGRLRGWNSKILPDITQRIESDCASEFHFPPYFGKLNEVNESGYAYISFRDQRNGKKSVIKRIPPIRFPVHIPNCRRLVPIMSELVISRAR